MTLKSRLCATALAISLSTPAAAATITLSVFETMYLIEGPKTFTDGFLPIAENVTLLPALPTLQPGDRISRFEYEVDVQQLAGPYFGYIIVSACYAEIFCPREIGMPGETSFHVGEVLRFMYSRGGSGVWAGYRPDIQLDLRMPEGVTLSHMPLPASWLLFASMLSLGGLFRWAKHRVVVP